MLAPPTTRAPLLWALIPWIAGITLAHWLPKSYVIPALGTALLLITIGTLFLIKKQKSWLYYGLFVTGCICLSSAYTLSKTPEFPRSEPLPPREANLTLTIDRFFSREDPYERQGGIAFVEAAPKHLQELQGQKLTFFLKKQAGQTPLKGETWTTRGILHALPENAPPFSFISTQKNEGIHFSLNRGTFLERKRQASKLSLWFQEGALRLKNILSRGTSPSVLGVYSAMLLGDKTKLAPETKTQFIQTGTLHLFAISGLHIGVIAFAIFTLLRWAALPRMPGAALGLTVLLLYVYVIGAPPSALRAFLMIGFLWGAHAFKRRPAPFSALVASALCVLAINPLQLWNPGFQLSYAVVTGILLYGLPLANVLKKWWLPEEPFIPQEDIRWTKRSATWMIKRLLESSAITFSATLLSTPLVLAYFHIFSPGAFFLNLVLIPLASVAITLGFASLLSGLCFIPLIPTLLNKLASLCIEALTHSVSWSAQLPYVFWKAEIRNITLSLAGILGLILLLLCTRPCMQPSLRLRLVAPILFAILWTMTSIEFPSLHMLGSF